VLVVAGHDRQIVNQNGGGNLYIERILRMWYLQSSPDLRDFRIELE